MKCAFLELTISQDDTALWRKFSSVLFLGWTTCAFVLELSASASWQCFTSLTGDLYLDYVMMNMYADRLARR